MQYNLIMCTGEWNLFAVIGAEFENILYMRCVSDTLVQLHTFLQKLNHNHLVTQCLKKVI